MNHFRIELPVYILAVIRVSWRNMPVGVENVLLGCPAIARYNLNRVNAQFL